MQHNKYRVFDKKNNFHQSYDEALQGAEQFAKDCARQIKGFVLKYSESDFFKSENPFKLYDFTDQPK
jgi:septation ring formation regulator EzrA